MKWLGIGLAALVVLAVGYAVWMSAIGNPRVVAELQSEPQGERARRVMLLSLPSGREVPVNYLREGDFVYAGADGPWWRELRGGGTPVSLLVMGESLRGRASAVENDSARTRDVFARLRPDVPAWLPGWLDAVLVVIELDAPPAATR